MIETEQQILETASIPVGDEVLIKSEQHLMVGSFAVASSHLLEQGSSEGLPEFRAYKIEGGLQELREQKDSDEYVGQYYDEGLRLAELMLDSGAEGEAKELIATLSYNLKEGNDGPFEGALRKNRLNEDQTYRLLAVISRSGNDAASNFSALAGRLPHNYVVDSDPKNEPLSAAKMIEKAKGDTNPLQGMRIASMYASFMSQSMVGNEKAPAFAENERLIKSALEVFGLEGGQIGEVFDALAQSGSEKYGHLMSQRIEQSTGLFMELRAGSDSAESYRDKVQKLYKTFGIRNFHRYTPQDILPQLDESFIPQEVVITAIEDRGTALSKPANSARGLQYARPVYYEAADGMGIAKALLSANHKAGKPLDKILVRAHGSPDGFVLSDRKFGDIKTEDLIYRGDKNGWEKQIVEKNIVDKNAEVVFESCSLGAGGFPQSLYERTGIEAFTASANIVGSPTEGSPGVLRVNGEVKFGTNDITYGEGRDVNGMTDAVSIQKR